MKYWLQRPIWRVESFIYQVRRTWGLVQVYWGTIDGDWSSIAEVMRYQIRRTREAIVENDIIVGAEHDGRRMLIAETLLTRMLEQPYFRIADKRYPDRHNPNQRRAWAHFVQELEHQDRDMLARQIRHLPEWWD